MIFADFSVRNFASPAMKKQTRYKSIWIIARAAASAPSSAPRGPYGWFWRKGFKRKKAFGWKREVEKMDDPERSVKFFNSAKLTVKEFYESAKNKNDWFV